MTTKLDLSKGILSPGDPAHRHTEFVKKDDAGHLIGTCACGRMIDYTLLQNQLPEMRDGYTQKPHNLNNFVKFMKGSQKYQLKRRKRGVNQ